MIAIEIAKIGGGPDVLRPVEMSVPQPASNEVLIRVHAAGINHGDIGQRRGSYPPPRGVTPIPGLEVAGTIAATGAEVRRWREGDRVCGLIAGGGYAEYCVVPAGQCLPVPSNLSFVEAASLLEVYATVWSNVWQRAKLASHETLLVHGGSSGIGVAALQLAVAMGNPVIVTVGSEVKAQFCKALGAVRAINYRTEDFVKECLASTSGHGASVILDMVGAPYVQRNLKALADEGRLVLIGQLEGSQAGFDISEVMFRRLTITGSTLRSRPSEFKSTLLAKVEEIVWPLIAEGKIRPIVHTTFPLVDASKAHAVMEDGQHMGKIVLTCEQ
jgi:NADPH:quinone reductase